MSGQLGSKSTTLRGPNFDDDMELEFLSTSTNLKTWKIIKKSSIKKAQFQDKILKSKDSFTIETTNRFSAIKEEYCGHNLHDPEDINNESISYTEDNLMITNFIVLILSSIMR